MANRNGNYSIDIKNYPNTLAGTSKNEWFTSFDNPNGSKSMYVFYVEADTQNPVNASLKLVTSYNRGRSWETQTISTLLTEGSDITLHYFYLIGSALAASPKGVIGTMTWANQSRLIYVGSTNNGNSWSNPIQVTTASQLGFNEKGLSFLYDGSRYYPQIELAILNNGTIYALSETNSTLYTPIVYFQSNNNGTTWSGPINVTCTEGLKCFKPRIQVDYSNSIYSGYYWLMWYQEGSYFNNVSWAQFTPSQSLSSSVTTRSVFKVQDSKNYDFDFYYNRYDTSNPFRVIQNKEFDSTYSQLIEWNTTLFTNTWSNKTLGESDILKLLVYPILSLNMYYDGKYYQYLYDNFFIEPDVNQYTFFQNNTFWQQKGTFSEYQSKQINWNGRINNTIAINTSLVEVNFLAQNETNLIQRTIFITIDNINPLFNIFSQLRYYFNPQSSNATLSNVQWDVIPSKDSAANLEVYSPNITTSNWEKITNNNWENSRPCIFASNTGQLYVLYTTLESNRFSLSFNSLFITFIL